MKQGRGNPTSFNAQKREPISHNVNPGAVDQLGQAMGTRRATQTLYEGKGVMAPSPKSCTVHHSGSQGKHR